MNNKSLRILIVEAEHLERFFLEKAMNSLGYYRIAPMVSFIEAMIAISDAVVPFDLLIVNSEQGCCADYGLLSRCKAAGRLRHSLVYGESMVGRLPQSLLQNGTVHLAVDRRPDIQMLKSFMKLIDPQIQCRARKVFSARVRRFKGTSQARI